jgi:ketol-acid reductoisomerase
MKEIINPDLNSIEHFFTKNKKIVMIGFGSQGSNQAQNLRDNGFNIKIALKEGSSSIEVARNVGFDVVSFEDGLKDAEIIILLTPDESHGEFFKTYIIPYFKKGGTVIVAHGFSFHFGYVKGFEDYNICMIAPKAVGRAVRENFLSGAGIFSLISIFHKVNEDVEQILLDLAYGIGSKKVLKTSFQEECESDLFGEQTVLCGGVVSLFKSAFEIMREAGFPDIIAYYECVHELKLIADLIYEKGVSSMFSSISNTAKYGGFKVGDFIVDESVKQRMREVLSKIKDGSFASNFMQEALEKNYCFKEEIKEKFTNSELEKAGQKVVNLLKNLK